MEPRQQLTLDGQEATQDDLNAAFRVASLQDDRVLAEIYRVPGYNGTSYTKAVIPYAPQSFTAGNAFDPSCTVQATGSANGSVQVMPFRAIVGARSTVAQFISAGEPNTQAATDAWRDIRSGVFGNSTNGTTLPFTQLLAANASGNPRWDLVYAVLSVEANGASVTEYVRPASGGAPAATTVVTTLVDTVTIAVVQGTPGASPAFPAAPADGGGVFNIPLAYVRVPNGFGGASTVASADIYDVTPAALPAATSGVPNCAPINQANAQGGSLLASSDPWTATAGTRPKSYLPPTMIGGVQRFLVMGMTGAQQYANNAILDNSIDWRNRAFMVFTNVVTGARSFGDPLASSGNVVPSVGVAGQSSGTFVSMGQSCSSDSIVSAGYFTIANYTQAASAISTTISFMAASSTWGIYVDNQGVLRFFGSVTNPQVNAFVWIFATAPFSNH